MMKMASFKASTVEKLAQSLENLLVENSARDAAESYIAAIEFLVHLKKDQSTLQKRGQNANDKQTCPPSQDIPAISAVLEDARLFGALISCLKAGNSQETTTPNESSLVGRKRSHSVTGDTPVSQKTIKLSHISPVPGRKGTVAMDANKSQMKPSLKPQILAASILFEAFSHVDHWPVQLVEAYAADCFGPRAWVDEEACTLLVKNLRLIHQSDSSVSEDDPEVLENATKVGTAYRDFQVPVPKQNSGRRMRKVVPRLPSFSSSNSFQRVERSVSTETIDSVVRAQIPYESGMDWEEEDDSNPNERMVSATPENVVTKAKGGDDGSSSSGGEDEHVVALSESNDGESENGGDFPKAPGQRHSNGSSMKVEISRESLYPLHQTNLNLQAVRQRYFGENVKLANDAIQKALLHRIDQKTRQNSGLLQTLPYFTSIPAVRSLVAKNLSKWLQSPALAGLARKLFAATVEMIKNIDPPLKEDLQVIDSILAMKLKANQFSAHMENLVAVAKTIPTPTVAQHIYVALLRNILASDSDAVQGISGDMHMMIGGVHRSLPPLVSYDAIAATLLTLLVQADESQVHLSKETEKESRARIVLKMRQIMRSLASSMPASFDSLRLMNALLSLEVDNKSWSIKNEEDRARLMFQCVTLTVSAASAGQIKATKGIDEARKEEIVRGILHKARKALLNWCCTDYGPRWNASKKRKRNDSKAGAGTPIYKSALGPMSGEESIPTWLNTMRCLLFIEEANSELMTQFLASSELDPDQSKVNSEEQERIKACCAYGADIDDDMIRIILHSQTPQEESLPAEMAIQLLEHLFESCGRTKGTTLSVSDPELVWELYKLAQYVPPLSLLSEKKIEDLVLVHHKDEDDEDKHVLPRLAYPGFWWRATMLGLVMCGASPKKIGEVVWKEHPTLRSLMKMVTSSRYRFPTVDCDSAAKELMKQTESDSREDETRIAEFLFLPPKQKKGIKNGKHSGHRMSRRIQKQLEEKEAAAALAESQKRKKMLKSAQKSIMIWDPDGPARKPPRESAELLLSVEMMFGLSDAFQQCTNPDFLLLTIGKTTRGAIERAYDWLIPIISKLPELIARLPSSTSCFLLLRAYGSETGGSSQLKKLSLPLLCHVKESLRGKYGEEDCIRAFELLMSDVSSHNADRRKSARRVLHDSLGEIESSEGKGISSASWMHNILLVEHCKSLVHNAIKHMSKAATFERGKVLKSLVVALRVHLQYAEDNRIEFELPFPALLCQLISRRPSVFAEAIDTFADLRSLTLSIVYGEIEKVSTGSDQHTKDARIWLDIDGKETEAEVSLDLLQSSCALLSIWNIKSDEDVVMEEAGDDKTDVDALNDLAKILLRGNSDKTESGRTFGLAGAKSINADDLAVSVESWIMLCKARSEDIAKKAALAVPEEYLARLLMSSGLPRTSLLLMVDRLGKLGQASNDRDEIYRNLLAPSATSEWDLGRIGKQQDVVRKLIGRLSAYFRLGTIDDSVSTLFIGWLVKESKSEKKATKPKKKKNKFTSSPALKDVTGLMKQIGNPLEATETVGMDDGEPLDSMDFFTPLKTGEFLESNDLSKLISHHLSDYDPGGLDKLVRESVTGIKDSSNPCSMALAMIRCVNDTPAKTRWAINSLSKWVPVLSKNECSDEMKDALFHLDDKATIPEEVWIGILKNCTLSWTWSTLSDCMKWILSKQIADLAPYSARRLCVILLAGLNESTVARLSEHESRTSCEIALKGLQDDVSMQTAVLDQRCDLPDSLQLLLNLAIPSKKHYTLVNDTMLQKFNAGKDANVSKALGFAFLRLYLLKPQWANTGNARVRNVLLKSAERNGAVWSNWTSNLDDQFADLLETFCAGDVRVVKLFNEQAHKHPLLVLRKSSAFVDMLKRDAEPSSGKTAPKSRGGVPSISRIQGQLLGQDGRSSTAEALVDGNSVQFHVCDWGYQFTDGLWLGVLGIYGSIHKEVLYHSGQTLGLWSLLESVLSLLKVQMYLTTANSTAKLKAKTGDMINLYRQVNQAGFQQWLSCLVEGVEVRNILVSLGFLSPEDAIQSLKEKA